MEHTYLLQVHNKTLYNDSRGKVPAIFLKYFTIPWNFSFPQLFSIQIVYLEL